MSIASATNGKPGSPGFSLCQKGLAWLAVLNATPLIALDAVVIDTETTGLDPAQGAHRRDRRRADRGRAGRAGEPLRALVRPDEPIPPEPRPASMASTTAAVRGAPAFRRGLARILRRRSPDTVVIGHTLGFDLAVLKRECERAGLAWRAPRTLDTRLLAELASPDLAGYLARPARRLARRRGRRAGTPRSPMPLTTARMFLALLPKLRERGIRTLGGGRAGVPCG